jgi:anti-sigma regulatory factor (Ser/Thr protein kinase)
MRPETFELRRDARAPGAARALVALHAGDAPAAAVADAKLLVTELVTNAVLHGARGPITLTIAPAPRGRLRIEVVDEGSGFVPRARARPTTEPGGWGLHLVETLSDRWGVRKGSTSVWFEIGPRAATRR